MNLLKDNTNKMGKKKVDKCICDQCPRRFVCFTQKKVFSDPAYQAMYEAFIEEGLEHKQAVAQVRKFIETSKETQAWRKRDQIEDWRKEGDWYKKTPDYEKVKWETYKDNTIGQMPVDNAKKAINDIKKFTRTYRQYYTQLD